ncbi:1-O-acylceramide synthase [Entamoeba marina]
MLLFCFVLFTSTFADTCERKPLVLIPGVLSSILEGEGNIPEDIEVPLKDSCKREFRNKRLWVALRSINPLVNECAIGYLNAIWDETTKIQHDIPGMKITVPKFGSTYALDSIDPNWPLSTMTKAFKDLIKKFEKLGYKDEFDMVGAPYDWRYFRFDEYTTLENWYENTKNLIQQTVENTGRKVVIISHSMGGLITYKLLDYLGPNFTDTYIERWIAISAPFLGSVETMAAGFAGDNLGFPLKDEIFQTLAQSVETFPFLFPTGGNERFGDEPIFVIDDSNKQYTVDDMHELIDTSDVSQFVDRAHYVYDHGINELYTKHNFKIPYNVEMNCLISSGIETMKTVVMETSDYNGDFSLLYGDGDGTVNIQSLEFCKELGATTFENLGKYDHRDTLDDDASYDAISAFICG